MYLLGRLDGIVHVPRLGLVIRLNSAQGIQVAILPTMHVRL